MAAPDARSSPADPDAVSDGASRRSTGSSGRLIVLLSILLVVGVATGWDYLVARPAFYAAQEKVEPLLPGSDSDAAEGSTSPSLATQKDVHAALGLTPAVTEPAGAYLVERYSWRRGIPWLTYNLWVVYLDDEQRTLHSATSVREEADLYYATARRPDPPPSDPAADPAGASEAPAESDASEASSGDAPDSSADDS